jgi:hypothetical protein
MTRLCGFKRKTKTAEDQYATRNPGVVLTQFPPDEPADGRNREGHHQVITLAEIAWNGIQEKQ